MLMSFKEHSVQVPRTAMTELVALLPRSKMVLGLNPGLGFVFMEFACSKPISDMILKTKYCILKPTR